MASIVLFIVKVMPSSPTSDLAQIKRKGEQKLVEHGATSISVEEKSVAFGLKALYFKFAWPEEKGSELVEELLSKIDEVSSVDIEDYRRALG